MYEKVESLVAACRPQKLNAGVRFGIVLVALAALCTCAAAQEDMTLALTNVISVGEDEFIEMANDGDEIETFEGLILTIDGADSVVLPDFILSPGERIRFHFIGHRLRNKSLCGSVLSSKSIEIGLVKEATASQS